MEKTSEVLPLVDRAPTPDSFRKAVLKGFQKPQKEVPSKFLYDERGSKLFDDICELEEYYPTRTETSIMERHVEEMVDVVGGRVRLVEYGSGSSRKTRILLEHLGDVATYVPVDISRTHLLESARQISDAYPEVPVRPVCADYTDELSLPTPRCSTERTVAYYPGSTIGNFPPAEACSFLGQIADTVGPTGGLLIGVDLKKDVDVLRAAYDDARGVTAAFNKNLLRRMNRELEANFDLARFEHWAPWNPEEGCIEMHLRSTTEQRVSVAGQSFAFEEGETIRTEYSYKYTLEDFAALTADAGFSVEHVWTDDRSYFSVQYCTVR